VDTFTKFQKQFGFGLKTNVDLAGEARTAGLVYDAQNMGSSELATGTFGQGFNVDMIEMITAFCSLVNGGNFYEPHMVSKIINSQGATVKSIEPRVLRQTVSESTSDKIIEYCNLVVAGEEGTGKTARPAGYMIGGKTGTAQTVPRGNRQYVVSFMGYAPANDPQIAIYVVVDRPNAVEQDDAKYATRIVRAILTEALPYLNFPMTEPVTEEEQAELEELRQKEIMMSAAQEAEVEGGEEGAEGVEEGAETVTEEGAEGDQENADGEEGDSIWEKIPEGDSADTASTEDENKEPIWKSFEKDEETGYYIDPETGGFIDPEDGHLIGGDPLPDMTIDTSADTTDNGRGD